MKIPGILVDHVVVDPAQRQTYATDYSPSYAGELRVPLAPMQPLAFGHRKIVARRAAMEFVPNAICNLGAGISTGIAAVAAEENIIDKVVLTNEQGFIGGAPLTGPDSGAAQNYDAVVDQPYQFDFYDGGGLDLAFLSFVEVDPTGSVNISRFADKIVGIGGFINISQNAKHVVFSGTFTAGGLEVACVDGGLRIVKEGRHKKFVEPHRPGQLQRALRREGGTDLGLHHRARRLPDGRWSTRADRDRARHRSGEGRAPAHGIPSAHRLRSQADGQAPVLPGADEPPRRSRSPSAGRFTRPAAPGRVSPQGRAVTSTTGRARGWGVVTRLRIAEASQVGLPSLRAVGRRMADQGRLAWRQQDCCPAARSAQAER